MGRPVLHFEIIGKDGAALASFYSQMFDWRGRMVRRDRAAHPPAETTKYVSGTTSTPPT